MGKKADSVDRAVTRDDFEDLDFAKMVDGNITITRGKYDVFLTISKKEKDKWTNLRLRQLDVMVLEGILPKFKLEYEMDQKKRLDARREKAAEDQE